MVLFADEITPGIQASLIKWMMSVHQYWSRTNDAHNGGMHQCVGLHSTPPGLCITT